MASAARQEEPASITCTPGIMGGMPCVAGTRVPADTILACINDGDSVYDIYRGYPWLPFGAVEAVAEWALANDRDISLPVRRVPDSGIGRDR